MSEVNNYLLIIRVKFMVTSNLIHYSFLW